mgnify:CR=1 FL=1
MSVHAEYSIWCDDCGRDFGVERRRAVVVAAARRAGWVITGDHATCPSCAKDGRTAAGLSHSVLR